jgi:hypothetical protein
VTTERPPLDCSGALTGQPEAVLHIRSVASAALGAVTDRDLEP